MTTQAHTQTQIDFAAQILKTNTATYFQHLHDKCRTYLTRFLEDMAHQSAIMDDSCGEFFIEPIYLDRLEKRDCKVMASDTKI